MTKEERQLLLKDLCARLPYVELKICITEIPYIGNITGIAKVDNNILFQIDNSQTSWCDVSEIKPFLRPMSSMTEKETNEWHKTTLGQRWITFDNVERCADWLNEHNFDYRGLIEKGLALPAPEGMYKTE